MIISWFEENCFHQEKISSDRYEMIVCGYTVIVIRDGTKHHLKFPYDLQCSMHTVEQDTCLHVHLRNKDSLILLYCAINSEYYASYRRFKVNDIFTISDDNEAQIAFKRVYLQNYEVTVDFLTHLIHVQGFWDAAINRIKLNEETVKWKNGDHLHILDLHIVLFSDGICINGNVEATLLSYHHDSSKTDRLRQVIPCTRLPGFSTQLQMNIEEKKITFQKPIQSSQQSPWLSAGQTLTMAIATLSIGILSAYQSYMDGNSWLRMVPYLIFPLVMIMSTLIWTTVRCLVIKRNHKRSYMQHLQDYETALMHEKERIRAIVNTYMLASEKQYPYMERLSNILLGNQPFQKHPFEERFCVRIGEKNDVMRFVSGECDTNDPKAMQIYQAFRKHIHLEQPLPWIISLSEHPRLTVLKSYQQSAFFTYVTLQLVMYTDTRLIVFLNSQQMEQYSWLRLVPNLLWNQNRMLYCDNEERYLTFPQEAIVMILDGKKREWIQESLPVIYFQIHNEQLYGDELIDLDHLMWLDYRTNRQQHFQIQLASDFQMGSLMQRFAIPSIRQKLKSFGILELAGCQTINELDIPTRWQQHDDFKHLKAMLGKDEDGNQIVIDLNEKYDGPHGLIAGMTGSGKSELLLTMILSLAISYSPEQLQFALIDFKGGGLSEALVQENRLPHIAGVLTNLQEEDMARALVSFRNECIRRQTLIARMNGLVDQPIMNLEDYCSVWKDDFGLERLGSLVIVVDEFAELKMEQPEFLHDLISIARIGRSLGVHLILSTQRPAGVVNDEIRANCSFIVCLKVAQRQDSFEVLHSEDAYGLKNAGDFILQSERQIHHGRSAYANIKTNPHSISVKLLDAQGSITKDSSSLFEKGTPEITQILSQIHHHADSYEAVYPLWLPVPEKMDRQKEYEPMMFGKIDDYYHHCHINLCLDQGGYISLIIGKDKKDKKLLFYSLLYTICQGYTNMDEIYLIDDLFFINRDLDCPMLIDILSGEQTEKTENLFHHLFEHEPGKNQICLMISDVSRFLDHNEKRQELFGRLIKEADHLQIRIVLFASGMQQLHYRELSSISHRYALGDFSISEMQQFFETSEKLKVKYPDSGLCQYNDHILLFRYIHTEENDLRRLMEKQTVRYSYQKPYQIPYMPSRRNGRDVYHQGIPLGIAYDDYMWVKADKDKMIYVVCLDRYEYQQYFSCMKKYCMCTDLDHYEPEETHLLFLTLDEYRTMRKQDIPVLFIGEGYQEQYTFHSQWKKLGEEEGILFYHRKGRKIALTNE